MIQEQTHQLSFVMFGVRSYYLTDLIKRIYQEEQDRTLTIILLLEKQ